MASPLLSAKQNVLSSLTCRSARSQNGSSKVWSSEFAVSVLLSCSVVISRDTPGHVMVWRTRWHRHHADDISADVYETQADTFTVSVEKALISTHRRQWDRCVNRHFGTLFSMSVSHLLLASFSFLLHSTRTVPVLGRHSLLFSSSAQGILKFSNITSVCISNSISRTSLTHVH